MIGGWQKSIVRGVPGRRPSNRSYRKMLTRWPAPVPEIASGINAPGARSFLARLVWLGVAGSFGLHRLRTHGSGGLGPFEPALFTRRRGRLRPFLRGIGICGLARNLRGYRRAAIN